MNCIEVNCEWIWFELNRTPPVGTPGSTVKLNVDQAQQTLDCPTKAQPMNLDRSGYNTDHKMIRSTYDIDHYLMFPKPYYTRLLGCVCNHAHRGRVVCRKDAVGRRHLGEQKGHAWFQAPLPVWGYVSEAHRHRRKFSLDGSMAGCGSAQET